MFFRSPANKTRRIRLFISYDGTNYGGWQKQDNAVTIQGEIEKRLSVMTRSDVQLHGAGRTDAGVHAEGMVAHFDCKSNITDAAFLKGLNSMLPGAIRILSAETCADSFHSRFSAKGKKYQYHIYQGKVHPPHSRHYSLHVTGILDFSAINKALAVLPGTHDFTSFENSGTRDKSITTGRGAVRTLYDAKIVVQNEYEFFFEFIGDGFLRNMVRNLVGSLLEVGRGKTSPEKFAEILKAKKRSAAGPTAPAHGLFLKEVYYTEFFLPPVG